MSGNCNVSASAGFIDLATFSELESFLIGGPHAISYFVAGVQKANWFTIVPIALRNNGTFDFGQECVSASVNRSGDYVLNTWFRCEIPTLLYTVQGVAGNSVRWTRNLMHNLIKKVSISFNELVVEELDNYWLDFNAAYRIPKEKQVAYNNMIGNISSLTNAIDANSSYVQANLSGGALFGGFFSVIIPFWYGEDSGIALPVAALPFNDIKINYEFRSLEDLLVFNGPNGYTIADLTAGWADFSATTGLYTFTASSTKSFRSGFTHAEYAVIHNDERTKMGDAPRDMLIRQVQTICGSDVAAGATEHVFDVRLSHSIINFFFALRNKTLKGDWSNYTTNYSYLNMTGTPPTPQPPVPNTGIWFNPINHTTLLYENTIRLDYDADFYALIHPFLVSDAVSEDTGMHMWSYALKPWDPLGPSGSTNYSKLANVQVRHKLSNRYIYYSNNTLGGNPLGQEVSTPLRMHSVFVAQNWNIARVANGSLGHPTL